jgi:hypothetical protein
VQASNRGNDFWTIYKKLNCHQAFLGRAIADCFPIATQAIVMLAVAKVRGVIVSPSKSAEAKIVKKGYKS